MNKTTRGARRRYAAALTALLAATAVTTAQSQNSRINLPGLFAFAEAAYPDLFPAASPPQSWYATASYDDTEFFYRHYPATGNYLGVASGMVYGMGPFTGQQLMTFGPASAYRCQADPAACAAKPTPTFNTCTDLTNSAYRIGATLDLVYRVTGDLVGTLTMHTVVEGPAPAAGPHALSIVTTARGVFTTTGNVSLNTEQTLRQQVLVSEPGIVFTLGTQTETIETLAATLLTPTTTTRTHVVETYQPGLPSTESTLQPGESLTKTNRLTRHVTTSPNPPTTGPYRKTHTFEGLETLRIGVRDMPTCRFAVGIVERWLLVGSGIVVKEQQSLRGSTYVMELEAATVDGVGL